MLTAKKFCLSGLLLLLIIVSCYAFSTDSRGFYYTDFEKAVDQAIFNNTSVAKQIAELTTLRLRSDYQHLGNSAYLLYKHCLITEKNKEDDAAIIQQHLASQATENNSHDLRVANFLCLMQGNIRADDSEDFYKEFHSIYSAKNQLHSAKLFYLLSHDYAYFLMEKGFFNEAVAVINEAIDITILNQDHEEHNNSLATLALLYNDLNQTEMALKINQQAINNAVSDYQKVNFLLERGYILINAQLYSQAIDVYQQIKQISAIDSQLDIIISSNLSNIYFETQAISENLAITAHLLAVAEKSQLSQHIAYAKVARAFALLSSGEAAQVEIAKTLFTEGYQWFESTAYDPTNDPSRLIGWAELLKQQGFVREAYDYLIKGSKLKDKIENKALKDNALYLNSVLEKERSEKQLLETKLQLDIKDAYAKSLNVQKQFWFLAALALVVLIVVTTLTAISIKRLNRELKEKNNALEYESNHDPLTQAKNRRYFYNYLSNRQTVDNSNKYTLLALLDIDFFKKINDVHGHDAGDKVLQIIVQRIKENLRACDQLVRWGGEEFLLHINTTPDQQQNRAIIQRILCDIERTPIKINDTEITVSVSIGFATLVATNDLEQHIKVIDNYLYQAKEQGRKRAIGSLNTTCSEAVILHSEL